MRILAIVLALVLVSSAGPPSEPLVEVRASEAVEDQQVKLTNFTTMRPSAMLKVPRWISGNPEPDVPCHLSLSDVIRIGLDHSDFLQTKPTADGLAIEPVDREESLWDFQARVMARVRTIEVAYWALWEQQAILKSIEAAVNQAEAILKQERDSPEAHSQLADIAEAEQAVEGFKLELVSCTSDNITTDRQLRNLVGLPPADGRYIIAATPPVEAKVVPDWNSSVRAMNASQPELARQQVLARLDELRLLLDRNQLIPRIGLDTIFRFQGLGGRLGNEWGEIARLASHDQRNRLCGFDLSETGEPGFGSWQVGLAISRPVCGPLANVRQHQYQLIRQRSQLQATTRQATDALDRSFREIATNQVQFLLDRWASTTARVKHEAQQGCYAEGRISADRMLDAIGQVMNATTLEARSLVAYNVALAEFEEAQGTLLDHHAITWAGSPTDASVARTLEAIPTELSDGSHGLRLILEGLPRLPESIGDPTVPF